MTQFSIISIVLSKLYLLMRFAEDRANMTEKKSSSKEKRDYLKQYFLNVLNKTALNLSLISRKILTFCWRLVFCL